MSNTASTEDWSPGCAYPPGVLHDHGHEDCHKATAVATARQAIQAFLFGLARGAKIAVCENDQCRVMMYRDTSTGSQVAVCPGCYGAAP